MGTRIKETNPSLRNQGGLQGTNSKMSRWRVWERRRRGSAFAGEEHVQRGWYLILHGVIFVWRHRHYPQERGVTSCPALSTEDSPKVAGKSSACFSFQVCLGCSSSNILSLNLFLDVHICKRVSEWVGVHVPISWLLSTFFSPLMAQKNVQIH